MRYRPLLLLCLSIAFRSHAALQVFPIRIHLSDSKRVAQVSLRHSGSKPTEYKITSVFYRMKPDGSMEVVSDPKPEERSAIPMIRFSPRQTVVPPKEEQIVRVMLDKVKDIPDGEYRAHLHFEPTSESEDSQVSVSKSEKVSLRLEARMAVAVPVIFRHGKPTFEVKLSDFQLIQMPDKKPGFSLRMASDGNAFPFGDFEVFLQPKSGGDEKQIGVVRGVASYLPQRKVAYPLTSDEKLDPGTVRVEFKGPQEDGGKVLATAQKAIP